MADRYWTVVAEGGRVHLVSREVGTVEQGRQIGSLPRGFKVVFDVAALLRSSGIPADRWLGEVAFLVGAFQRQGAPAAEATCRSCGAPVVWAKTANDRAMPLDARPEKRVVVEDGVARVVDAFVAHWASCPNADEHRKGATQ